MSSNDRYKHFASDTLEDQSTARTLPWNEALEVINVFMYSFIVSRQRNIRFRLLLGCLLLLGQVLDDLLLLGLETLLSALTGLLCLWTTSFGLVAVRQSIGRVNNPTFSAAEPQWYTTGLSWHWKIPALELTPGASCGPCLPSACECAPWGCACS